MGQNMDKYKDLFLEESKDRLEELDRQILALEKDPGNLQHVEDMFRTAHTMKGMAATMGFNDFAHLTHQMENIMDIIKNQGHLADLETTSLLFECRDVLDNSIGEIENGDESSVDYSGILNKLDAYINKLSSKHDSEKNGDENTDDEPLISESKGEGEVEEISSNFEALDTVPQINSTEELLDQFADELMLIDEDIIAINKITQENKSVYLVQIKLFEKTEMKYARAYLCVKKVKDFGTIYRMIPDEADLKEENFGTEFSIIVFIDNDKKIKYLQQDIESVAAVETVDILLLKKSLSSETAVEKKNKSNKTSKDKDFSVQNVKVSIKHLDNLMNMTGELLISKIRLDKVAQTYNIAELNETLNLINRITFDLQEEVLQMRMIPVSHIFDRFPRMVRDLTKSLGKLIDFSMEGRDIELDRTIIDQIGDPIVHLLRNSIDHGIEMPDEREKIGKNQIASLKLLAYRDKNYVVIEISDDGKGIDFNKIKEKALEKHLITAEDAEKMTDYDSKRLLLGGGISTADKLSEISGRGVGLGVVKQKIEALGGIVDVESKMGKGSTFRLKLPLTVAIIKSLLVSLGAKQFDHEETYAIPINNVVRTIVIHEEEIRTIKNKEVITILGKIVSIVRLRELVQFKNQNEKDKELDTLPMKTIIVIERGGMEVGLLVDNLIGQQEIVIKTLGGMLKGVKGVSGGAILGDGKVALIIDVSSLF
ncbi:chemotaxis protein CheW [Candidatus Lokiarchaeum ossiferum]|uniref:chemotaxis protein CheW n=1 Tax=Candidatus Lokiarchaeum ossiferum TaxID=2951803 RepID=UPI00352EADF5